ncbi:MAG: hypothetical protein AAF513_13460 [Pseudomonadota bacterium]
MAAADANEGWTRATAAVAALAFASFAAALPNGPLGDDLLLLEQRLDAEGWLALARHFGESWWGTLHEGGLYRPVSLVLLGAQKLLFGEGLAGFHAVGLAVHAATSVLCLVALRRLDLPTGPAFAGAALFACHPIHAEAVATLHGQPDLYAACFAMAALVHPGLDGEDRRKRIVGGIGVGLLGLASLLSKESALLLPLFSAGLRAVRDPGSGPAGWWGTREWILTGAVLVAVSLRFAVLGSDALPQGEGSVAHGYPLWARVQLVVVTLGTYLKLLVLPWGQTIYYGHLRDAIFGTPLIEAAWLAVGALALFVAWRSLDRRLVACSLGALALGLAPVANVVPIGVAVAERCLYLPSLALAPLAAAVWARVASARVAWPKVGLALLLIVSLVLCVRVSLRWQTPLAHWEATAADHPRSPKAHAVVARLTVDWLEREGAAAGDPRWSTVEGAVERALTLNPQLPDAFHARGRSWIARGDCSRAFPDLRRAQQLRPGDPRIAADLSRCAAR